MATKGTPRWLDALGLVLTAGMALLLRSNLGYRTAFVDEAINLFGGWKLLHGEDIDAIRYHMGWPALSFGPLGLAGWLGGLEAARAFNAVLGTVTVLLVMLIAHRVYGRVAGFVAAGLFAAYGPAIFISTFATYDALSVLLVAGAAYFWLAALTGRHRGLYAAGSLAMAWAVLAKYAAVMVALLASMALALVVLEREFAEARRTGRRPRTPGRKALTDLLLIALPLLIVPAYALRYRDALLATWHGQVLIKQIPDPGVQWAILQSWALYLGPLALLGLAALLDHRLGGVKLLLWAIGLGMIPYHLLNRDNSTLYKHTCYMAVGLVPLAAGGLVALTRRLTAGRLGPRGQAWAIGLAGAALLGAWAARGQCVLAGLRSFWPDTTEAVRYLRERVPAGSEVLMEAGMVGQYYLIEKGVPGHTPREVHHTWYYADEKGVGVDAYTRGIAEQRFDWVVFDYTMTPELDRQLLPLMLGRYRLAASFAAGIDGNSGRIDVYQACR